MSELQEYRKLGGILGMLSGIGLMLIGMAAIGFLMVYIFGARSCAIALISLFALGFLASLGHRPARPAPAPSFFLQPLKTFGHGLQ